MSAVRNVLSALEVELLVAQREHPPMHSPHEGYAVIREELEELWEHVKADTGASYDARSEAIQLAAMACRYVLDICDAERRRNGEAVSSTERAEGS